MILFLGVFQITPKIQKRHYLKNISNNIFLTNLKWNKKIQLFTIIIQRRFKEDLTRYFEFELIFNL